jgi:hypothetical protein
MIGDHSAVYSLLYKKEKITISLSLLDCCTLSSKLSLIHCFLLVCLEIELCEQVQEESHVDNEEDAEKPRKIAL